MKDMISCAIENMKEKLSTLDMPPLKIGSCTIPVPIIQGGMGVGISLSSLASAAAQQGGAGVIAANGIGMIDPDYFKNGREANIRALKQELRKAREKTHGVIGVNIMVALQDFDDLLHTSIDEGANLLILGAGLPVKNIPVKKIREQGAAVIPIVSSSRAAELIFKMWHRIYQDVPDGVIIEGPKAGGHLGFSLEELDDPQCSLEAVIPQVKSVLRHYEQLHEKSIPIIAAGGIYTGEDIFRVFSLGAKGVQIGTRFAATDECDADIRFKQAITASTKQDIGIIKSPVGMPGRALINPFLIRAEERRRSFACPWQCLAGCRVDEAHYCISLALNQARLGNLDKGFVFVGSNAWRISKIQSTASIFRELTASYRRQVLSDALKLPLDFTVLSPPMKPMEA